MSTWVEVHCDVQRDGRDPAAHLVAFCWSHRGDNPSGWSIRDAKDAAREVGWKLSRGNNATCPNCASGMAPFWFPEDRATPTDQVKDGKGGGE